MGLHFELESGWHIYWINPGDSGEPPRVQWRLPAGFRAESIQWPAPQRIEDHSLVDYGYEGEALLMVPVESPADLEVHESVKIEAQVVGLPRDLHTRAGGLAGELGLSTREDDTAHIHH